MKFILVFLISIPFILRGQELVVTPEMSLKTISNDTNYYSKVSFMFGECKFISEVVEKHQDVSSLYIDVASFRQLKKFLCEFKNLDTLSLGEFTDRAEVRYKIPKCFSSKGIKSFETSWKFKNRKSIEEWLIVNNSWTNLLMHNQHVKNSTFQYLVRLPNIYEIAVGGDNIKMINLDEISPSLKTLYLNTEKTIYFNTSNYKDSIYINGGKLDLEDSITSKLLLSKRVSVTGLNLRGVKQFSPIILELDDINYIKLNLGDITTTNLDIMKKMKGLKTLFIFVTKNDFLKNKSSLLNIRMLKGVENIFFQTSTNSVRKKIQGLEKNMFDQIIHSSYYGKELYYQIR